MKSELQTNRQRAREIVMRHGRLPTAYQILNPDFCYWFDEEIDAVAGYFREGDWWAVGGGPICAPDVEREACRRLEADAAKSRRHVIYVCADERLRRLLGDEHHSAVTLGAEPFREPARWPARVKSSASLRQQLNRSRNKGVVVHEVTPADVTARMDELKDVVLDWLTTRPLPAMRFLNDPRTLDGELADRRIWLATQHERPVAFLLASPVVRRNGFLMEQISRRHNAPNGTAELLIDAALRAWAAEGKTFATLGMVVLSTHVQQQMAMNPPWVRTMFSFARAHGRRFYHYDGLEKFREKLQPDGWEPIYLIANQSRFTPAALYAAGAAFCGERSPMSVVASGIAKAFKTELGWASGFLSRVLTGAG
jgi:phosphatidylglycerol lysyltransferase